MENKNYFIGRFYDEHRLNYETALKEIKKGRKFSHWMWFVFPQLKHLGSSNKAIFYGLENAEEAKEYYNDSYLGASLREICYALMECESSDPFEVMGFPDNLKLCSSMTLFYLATNDELFKAVLDKFYGGKADERTVELLKSLK